MKENNILQVVIILILFLTLNLIFHFTQKRIILNDGKGFDGVEYYKISEQFSEGKTISGSSPLVYRIGTPFLASIIDKDNLLSGFFYANFTANFLSCILLFSVLKIYIKNFYIILFLITLYLLHPLCSTRFIYFCPVISDPWGLVFFLAGLLLIEKIRQRKSFSYILIFSVFSFLGVLFREYIIVLPVSLLFIENPIEKKYLAGFSFKKFFSKGFAVYFPLLAGLAGIAVTHIAVINTDSEYSFFKTILYFFYERPLFRYVYSWLLAVGPVIAVLFFFFRDVFKFLIENQHLFFLTICALVLSFLVGSDSVRIILWFIPVILLLEGVIIEKNLLMLKKIFFVFPLVLFQCISMKVFTQIPEPVRPDTELGVPISPVFGGDYFLNLISSLDDLKFEFVSFLKYSLAVCFLLFLLRYYKQKAKDQQYSPENNI